MKGDHAMKKRGIILVLTLFFFASAVGSIPYGFQIKLDSESAYAKNNDNQGGNNNNGGVAVLFTAIYHWSSDLSTNL